MNNGSSAGNFSVPRRAILMGMAALGASILPSAVAFGATAAMASPIATKPKPAFLTAFPHTAKPQVARAVAPAAGWYQAVVSALRAAEAPAPAPAPPPVPSGAALQAAIVSAASSQIGRTDAGAYGGIGGEWCAAFASWVYRSAGLHIDVLNAAYQIGSWAYAGGGTLLPPSAAPQVGDAVLFEPNGSSKAWPGTGLDISNIAHVNIVVSVGPDGSFKTIGGNEHGAVREQGPYSAANAPTWWGQRVYGFVRPA